jgi:aldehyde:ferredoxin oxidoreductase
VSGLSPQAYPYEWFSYSSVGGYWGPALKYAGYDAVIVHGQAERPVYLWIDDEQAELRDAKALWGHGIMDTQRQIMTENGGDVRVLTIGQAGENRSRIAIIATGTGSAAGQGGFGAVMGAKHLKAIAVRGTGGIPLAYPEAFSDFTLSVAKEMHAPCGCPKKIELNLDLVTNFGERFVSCTQQCASPICLLGRYYQNVPGVLHTEKKYTGSVFCVSQIFGGAPNTFYDWKTGFQAGFELANISHDLGLNHWELGIGMVPWLRKCHADGLLPTLDGHPFDLDSPGFWEMLFKKIAYREGIGDALAEGGVRAAMSLGIGQELIPEFYTAWGFAGHWDGRGDRSNIVIFPYWLVTALQWAVGTRDPMSSGHGYAQNIMMWSPIRAYEEGLDWEILADVGAKFYGTRESVHPTSGYEAKAYPAVVHGHRSIMKDSLTVGDQAYPRIYSAKEKDHFARNENGIPGPSFEYHMFRLATGMEISEQEFDQMAERVFNLERALQVRNWGRSRSVDEQVIPYFERVENWINPFIGKGLGLDREAFAGLLNEYYTLRGWDLGSGRPTTSKLESLGLGDVARALADSNMSNPKGDE